MTFGYFAGGLFGFLLRQKGGDITFTCKFQVITYFQLSAKYNLTHCQSTLWKRLRIRSVISINYHYITVLCPFNIFALNATILYKTNLNNYKYVYFTCFVNKIEIQAIFFIFNTNPRFPPFLLYHTRETVSLYAARVL